MISVERIRFARHSASFLPSSSPSFSPHLAPRGSLVLPQILREIKRTIHFLCGVFCACFTRLILWRLRPSVRHTPDLRYHTSIIPCHSPSTRPFQFWHDACLLTGFLKHLLDRALRPRERLQRSGSVQSSLTIRALWFEHDAVVAMYDSPAVAQRDG